MPNTDWTENVGNLGRFLRGRDPEAELSFENGDEMTRCEKEIERRMYQKYLQTSQHVKLSGWGVGKHEGVQILGAWGMFGDEGKDKLGKEERGQIMKGLSCQAEESDFFSQRQSVLLNNLQQKNSMILC